MLAYASASWRRVLRGSEKNQRRDYTAAWESLLEIRVTRE
jgi:hypothetical protein